MLRRRDARGAAGAAGRVRGRCARRGRGGGRAGAPRERLRRVAARRVRTARRPSPRGAVALVGATVAFAAWAIVERRGRAAIESREAARLSERLAEIETARVVLD